MSKAPAPPVYDGQQRIVRLILMVITAILGVMAIYPLLYMLSISFKPPPEVFRSNVVPAQPTLANFFYVLTEVPFWHYLANTFIVSSVVTVVALFFHTMAGYALARLRFPGREAVFLAMLSTFLVSLPVIIVPLFAMVRMMGMVNSWAGLIIPSIFDAFGIFLLRQYYLSLPRELEEAALIDGAGYWRIYWSIILPLSRPIVSTLAILFFLANWNSFLWPLTVAPQSEFWVVQVAIANFKSQYSAAWNYTMAASVIVAIPMLVVFVIFQRQIMDSIKTTGLK